ncbi:oligosaccharide flippase family protein [Taibaiella koreensis]|uniref:oligosaccharide flippase family protein n=1 Tax=Taibaiella koreensis TaxID=1268548 RepID=UPI000E59E5C7|nr:oligosaccharide flippase family protein [Taibaiella koreensis]
MIKKLFSDSLIYAIGPQLPKLVGIFLLPIITRYLTADDYAIWGLATAYVAALSGLRDLGFTQVLVNFFFRYTANEKRWKIVWRQLMGILSIWGIFYGIILAIVLYLTLHNKVGDNIWSLLFYIVIPAVFFDIISLYGQRFYQFSSKPIPIAISSICSGIISISVNYIAVVHWHVQYMSFFMALFAASLFNALYFFRPVILQQKLLPIFKIRIRRLMPHLKVGLPTIPHTYSAYLLNTSDRVILDIYKQPLHLIGQYNFAYNFGNYAELVGNAIGMAVSPFYTRSYSLRTEDGERQVKIFTFLLQAIFLLGTVLIAIWCREILNALSSNAELAATYPFVIIIIMSYTYRPMYWVPVSRLGFEEKTNHLWKISFIGGLINVVLNMILIPFWGIYAVVVSTFIGLMYIGFSGFYLKAFKKLNSQKYYPMAWLGLILISTVGVMWIRDFSVIGKLSITFGLALLSVFVLWKNRKWIYMLKEMEL